MIPEDETLRQWLLKAHHDVPLAGHLGVFRIVKALNSRYYWCGI